MNPNQAKGLSDKAPQILKDIAPSMMPSVAMNAIRTGKTHQVYGISDFN